MAFKIALLFDVEIEAVFLYQEKSPMQNLLEKIDNFTQWLPKGERFSFKAIEAIEYAQRKAALSEQGQVEPEHILQGILSHPTTTAAHLLRDNGFTLNMDDTVVTEVKQAPKINKFSSESRYVLELALNAARLKQKKYIDTEHLLLGLIQLLELGNNNLIDIFQTNEVDIQALTKKVRKLNS